VIAGNAADAAMLGLSTHLVVLRHVMTLVTIKGQSPERSTDDHPDSPREYSSAIDFIVHIFDLAL
jgi:hypothetical protein